MPPPVLEDKDYLVVRWSCDITGDDRTATATFDFEDFDLISTLKLKRNSKIDKGLIYLIYLIYHIYLI